LFGKTVQENGKTEIFFLKGYETYNKIRLSYPNSRREVMRGSPRSNSMRNNLSLKLTSIISPAEDWAMCFHIRDEEM
jgi:hypothetical protein